jgi:Ca2+-binding EF-hand superfamily protein
MADNYERKLRAQFRKKDFDNDGVISRKDFVGLAERFADEQKFNPQQKNAITKTFDQLFSHYVKAAGKHTDTLTPDLFVESLRAQKDDPALRQCLRHVLRSMLEPLDVNKDGYIDAKEFRKIYENMGITDTDFTKPAFDAINKDQDDKLSFQEFEEALIDHTCSDKEDSVALFGLDV